MSFNLPLVNNCIYCILKGAGRVIRDIAQTLEFIQMFSIRLHILKTAAMLDIIQSSPLLKAQSTPARLVGVLDGPTTPTVYEEFPELSIRIDLFN